MTTVKTNEKEMKQAAAQVAKGKSKAQVALEYGISPRTLTRWIEKVNANAGPHAPEPVKAPVAAPTTAAVDPSIASARAAFAKGDSKAQIAREHGVSRRTVNRWLEDQPEAAPAVAKAASAKVVAPVDDVEYSVVASSKSVSLTQITNGKVTGSVVIDKTADNFTEVLDIVKTSNFENEKLAKAFAIAQPKTMVESYTQGKLKVDVRQNQITYTPEEGVPFQLSGLISKRIVNTIKAEGVEGAKSLINFLDKLLLNPSYRAVNELYGFLEHNDIKLTPEGKFIAWKVVRNTYMDKHSNTMDNSVGKVLRVNRNQVDEDSNSNCSYGLHVCAKQYIDSFYNGGDRIVTVEVDPADVVAIPKDYNNSKMRCAGYVVTGDVTKMFKG